MHEEKGESRSIGRKLSHISKSIQWIVRQELEPFGIGSGQHCFLMIAGNMPGITQNEISVRSGIDKATAAKGVFKLEKLGYLKRICDSNDKRVRRLYLTEKGKGVIPEIRKCLNHVTEICSDNLSPEEIDYLFKLLDKIEDSANNYLCMKKNRKVKGEPE